MLPVMLNLQDRRVLMVGGGVVATRRTKTLLAEGARVEVVAPSFSQELEELAQNSPLRLTRRGFIPDDVDGAWLVFAHTDSPAVQQLVKETCDERNIWCLVGGAKEKSGFWMMAHRTVQDLLIAVSAGGHPLKAKETLEKLTTSLKRNGNTPGQNKEL